MILSVVRIPGQNIYTKISNRYIMVSFRSVSWVLLLILVLSYLPLFPGSSAGETATGNLYVTNNSALASSPFVRSGSGTTGSPYIISDWDMGSYYIRLDDTTSNVVIRDITFTSSSSWGLYLDNSDNIVIKNVSSSGRGKFLYSNNCQNINVDNCNTTSIPSETSTVDIRNGVSFQIKNSRFVAETSATTKIYYNDQGSNQLFFNNYLNGVDLTDENFLSDGRMINSTFLDSKVILTGGRQGSAVTGNTFISPGKDTLTLNNCYYLDIGNNYFEGDKGIYFYTGTWQNSNIWGMIHNNTFESSTHGIFTRTNYQARPSRYLVTNNYFGNCSTYAIDWGYGMTCRVWKNVFYHNAGTDNTSAGSQCKQYNWGQNLYKIQWTDNDQGNFWANHRTPDNDFDGIVDSPYSITAGGSDTHPYSNPYFDTEVPELEILAPVDLYPDRSYLLLTIRAEDEGSGIRTLELKIDNGQWTLIKNEPNIPVFLDEGNHFVNLRATDRAGMVATTMVQYILSSTFEFLEITAPMDREYRSTNIVDITWNIEDYFTPVNQTLKIDGEILYLDPLLRVYRTQLDEGAHDISVGIEDSYGLSREKSINFTIDLTDPTVSIISPQDGSTLSNTFVKINYDARDNIGLGKFEIMLDDGDWMERPLIESQFSVLIDEGHHTINIRATDLSGRESLDSISFDIGETDLLRFISPENGSSYKESLVRIKWEYDGPFAWE